MPVFYLILGIMLASCGMFGKKKSNSGVHVDSAQTEEANPGEIPTDEEVSSGDELADAVAEAPSEPETAQSAPQTKESMPEVEEVIPPPPSVLRTKTELKAAVARMWGHKQSDINPAYLLVQNSLPASNIAQGNIHPEFLTAIARLSSSACDLFWSKKTDAGDWDENTSQAIWMEEILSRAFIKEADKAKAKLDIEAQLQISGVMSNSEKFSLSCSVVTASKAFL
ncbi:MAG: hypothetical protein AB8G05_17240 [Oligoflexales bacterium]